MDLKYKFIFYKVNIYVYRLDRLNTLLIKLKCYHSIFILFTVRSNDNQDFVNTTCYLKRNMFSKFEDVDELFLVVVPSTYFYEYKRNS